MWHTKGKHSMYENYQVLFVDDEADVLSSLKRGLIDEEYNCLFASDGYKALEVMDKNPIAVLVSDMRMPGMDGLKFLNEVRARWPQTVRIVLSGYVQLPQILLTINQPGVFRFITKPWKLEDEFIGTIREALDHYILNEENENHLRKLENQKTIHLTMIHRLEAQNQFYKMSIDFLVSMGKSIVSFNNSNSIDMPIHKNIKKSQNRLFELIHDGIIAKSEVFKSRELTERLSLFIQSLYTDAKITSLVDRDISVNVFYEIIAAVIQASSIIFNDVFCASGVSARIGVESNDYYCIYLVSSFDNVSPEEQILIDQKLEYFSKALDNMSVFHLNCFMSKYNKKNSNRHFCK